MTGAVRRWASSNYIDCPAFVVSKRRNSLGDYADPIEVEIRPVQAEQEEKSVSEPDYADIINEAGQRIADRVRKPVPPLAGMKRGWLHYHPAWSMNKTLGGPVDDHCAKVGEGCCEIEYRIIEKPPTPARCVCGAEVDAIQLGSSWAVRCRYDCWSGPRRHIRDEAIRAWNELQDRK